MTSALGKERGGGGNEPYNTVNWMGGLTAGTKKGGGGGFNSYPCMHWIAYA